MDPVELGDMGSGCEDTNCGLASGFQDDCSNEECYWEEHTFGMIELACVTAIYIPLMLFGLLGNILTILVVWLRPHMRSSTYLYLSSMAVSDLLILLLLPLDLYKLWRPRPWPLGDLACKLTVFLSECCTFCTILHITFLSLERYVAVCWPITAKTLVTRRRTRALIGCLWLGAAVSAAPVLVMVGVEDVGTEELGLSGWTGDTGWTSRESEQDAFLIGRGEGGSEHVNWMDGRFEEIKWDEKETKGWSGRVGEEGDKQLATEESEVGETQDGKEADEGGGDEGEGNAEDDGMQQNKLKEDEGGGREEDVDARRHIDKSECRCTHYAVSSGLLSAMMILSNLYFLVPLCILGLVYSLIGRTLWLRPKSSRKDQSHRHTVKMLGVIVLAFVLCWLPFHVGRTIFSLSLGTGAERQEMHTDTPHSDMTTLPDSTGDMHATGEHVNQPDTYAHIKSPLKPAYVETDTDGIFCDACAKTKDRTNTHPYVMTHTTPDMSTHTTTHAEQNHDQTPGDTQVGKFADTNTTIQNNITTMCIDSQNDTVSHTRSPSGTGTYVVTPTDLRNNTHSDTHLYFVYYLSQYFNLVSSVLFYLSAAVNPLLYNLMSARYRHAVHSLIHAGCHTQSHRAHTTLSAQQSTTTV